jgi:hypothetical protein
MKIGPKLQFFNCYLFLYFYDVKNLYLLCCIAVVALNSCQKDLYIPDHIYAPTYTRAGEATMNASTRLQKSDRLSSGVSSNWSFSADAGYALTDHFGLFGSYRNIYNKGYEPAVKHYPDEVKLLNSQRYDVAAGYYKYGEGVRFDAFGGLGTGYTERSGLLNYGNYQVRYDRLFAQVSGGVGGSVAWFVTGMKFTAQRYRSFSSSTPAIRDSLNSGELLNVEHQSVLFGEPFIEGRVGYKNVHFTAQMGISAQMGGTPVSDYLFLPPYITIGMDVSCLVRKRTRRPVDNHEDSAKKQGNGTPD